MCVAQMADVSEVSYCPYCHNLDLRNPVLKEELSEESIEAGLYRSWGDDSAAFNILGEHLGPDNPRLSQCITCTLLSDFIHQLDPVLSVVRNWEGAEIFIYLEASKNIEIYTENGFIMPVGRCFELYTPANVEYPFPGQGRPSEDLDSQPGNEKLWKKLRTWLSSCQREHVKCQSQKSSWKPTRLVKVDKDNQHLVITSEAPQGTEPFEYAALSHCWGKEQPLRTLSHNLADHISDLQWHKLPRVFQDSLTVVRELGIPYLWIDSLCIIQDNADDWARESGMMGSVYEQACLTISATRCENGTVPFLGSDVPNRLRRGVACTQYLPPGAMRSLRARRIPDDKRFEGPIMYRAWTLQERFLSPRILHFTQFQAQWKCSQILACESGTDTQLPSARARPIKDAGLKIWNETLREYSMMALTKFSDKLPAISGLAAGFQTEIGSEYLAGLWKTHLPQQLAWCMEPDELTPEDLFIDAASTLPMNRPPSWSWASIIGRTFEWQPTLDKSYITIENIKCEPSTSNVWGEVKSGASLDLQCLLLEVEVIFQPQVARTSRIYCLKLTNEEEERTISCLSDCLLAACILGGTRRDQWAARATADSKINHEEPWSAKAMLMPLVAERETPPCALLLGKQPGYEGHVFQRIAFVNDLLEEDWLVVQKRLESHNIVLQ